MVVLDKTDYFESQNDQKVASAPTKSLPNGKSQVFEIPSIWSGNSRRAGKALARFWDHKHTTREPKDDFGSKTLSQVASGSNLRSSLTLLLCFWVELAARSEVPQEHHLSESHEIS